ncbi:MAG: hypothetical protein LBR16_08705 [Treponema sp.]|jgi:hypothetical protein|nr:hypothetical protein [Treponema sp.]
MHAPRTRYPLVVTAAFLVLAAFLAEGFLLSALDHDCIGEGCPVCAQIHAAQRILEGLCRLGAAVLFAGAASLCAAYLAARDAARAPALRTPVTLKIKITS